jgi:two-component system, OmpR family, sensor histidine kinase TctE
MNRPVSRHARSIRRRLLALLIVPALILLMAGTVVDYVASIGPVEDAYDQALIDSALAIGRQVHADASGAATLALLPDAVSILRADSFDSVYYRVSTAAGRLIAGDSGLPESPDIQANPSRVMAQYRGAPIRLVTYRTVSSAGPVSISVAETLHKRERTHSRTLTRELAVDLAQLATVFGVLWFGIGFALRPLGAVREQIERRSARALDPMPLESVPLEIRSIVAALNGLFATVRESSVAQRRFLESAAHQLRTPLTGIQAQLELLAAEEPDTARRERLLLTLGGARRLTHTTQQLLTLARSDEAANLRWGFSTVELTQLVESVVADRLGFADMARVDLGAQLQPVRIQGVEWLLAEALSNLVNNAIAHTPGGGSITIHCGALNFAPYVEVVDTGVGIPVEERDRVRERFFRASNARGMGSGLGLSIVMEVAQLHGAEVLITSGPDGRGTSVRLVFHATLTAPRSVDPA